MTETHTPYQRGRRAAERGAPREVPADLLQSGGITFAENDWKSGYDSVSGGFAVIEEAASSVNHPRHYNAHPSGIECIQVVEHMSFNLGNALKYIWRADEKGNALEDLKKAEWYIQREIARREEA
ncbi:DUF3310 domain-containing protein [Komagataeibacter xylinus]|uniref:DUF3310 domain-containing protein n=1 Tax=Komagataeibacter xylinus TaxID=28448 RepID=UPI001F1053F8|nr:DUF3310 domain-containing protein [Komagataeibacter xylinus]